MLAEKDRDSAALIIKDVISGFIVASEVDFLALALTN
jgi:hypothetical protein